jgi:hypothetical protein
MTSVTRRTFLGGAAAAAGLALAPAQAAAQASPIPIIDTHIHLFDPARPQGAPYSGPRVPGQAPIAAYPDRYRKLAGPLGAVELWVRSDQAEQARRILEQYRSGEPGAAG